MNHPDKEQALALLANWQTQHDQMEALFAGVFQVFGCNPESQLHETVWKLFDAYTSTLAQLLGDENGSLEWHCMENDMGAKALEAGYVGQLRPIATLGDLYALIAEDYEQP